MIQLKEFNKRAKQILSNSTPDLGEIEDLLFEVHKIAEKDRDIFKEYYLDFGEELFNRNIISRVYDPLLFVESNKKRTKTLKKKSNVSKENKKTKYDFDEKLENLIKLLGKSKHWLRHYVLLCNKINAPNIPTDITILCDYHSGNPLVEILKSEFYKSVQYENLLSYVENLKSNNNGIPKNNIFVIFLSQDLGDYNILIESLKYITSNISNIKRIEIEDYENVKYKYFDNFVEIIDEIKYSIGIELINSEINLDIECILKKIFKDKNCNTIEYEIKKGGFSGSKVIEVQPFKKNIGETCKYVVKIADYKNNKIDEEKANFDKFVDTLDNLYSIQVEKTNSLKAILYPYASVDAQHPSVPYSTLLKQGNLDKKFVKKLFGIKLFSQWYKSKMKTKMNVWDSYKHYIDKQKIYIAIDNVTGYENKKLKSNIEKIFKIDLEINRKVCHGDLHTENFFIDSEGVYLIDFGHTGLHHSLIDHVALECSIKFKHIPTYINIDKLIEIEREMIEKNSFNSKCVLKSIKRADLMGYFDLVTYIRELSNDLLFSKENKLEYYIALLSISLRQIQYPDLNQLYALKSSEILANHIILNY